MQKCLKCGKIYLKQDSPAKGDDKLNICECGGKLVYIQDFMGHVFDELDPFNEIIVSSEFTILKEDNEKELDDNESVKEKNKDKKKKKKK